MDEQELQLMKSKYRVQKHGEVFTPQWVVDKMISIPGIKEKTEDVFATFLEPSAGEGAFLLAIEDMKLRYITDNYDINAWNQYALWALTSIYGIEFLEDNLEIARQNMLQLFVDYYEELHKSPLLEHSDIYKSAQTIIWANVVQGNTLTHKNLHEEEIVFSYWEQVPGKPGKVQRTPFNYSSLFTQDKPSGTSVQLSMFETYEQLSIFSLISDKKNNSLRQERYSVVDIDQVWREQKENG